MHGPNHSRAGGWGWGVLPLSAGVCAWRLPGQELRESMQWLIQARQRKRVRAQLAKHAEEARERQRKAAKRRLSELKQQKRMRKLVVEEPK